jgi:hypothetical protein
LTITLHFSGGKAHAEMPDFAELCQSAENNLDLLNGTSSPTDQAFDPCRRAIIIYVKWILTCDKTSPVILADSLKSALQESDLLEDWMWNLKLLLWILFMGIIASSGAAKSRRGWFQMHFLRTSERLGLNHYEAIKRVLVEYLWFEDACDEELKLLWKEVGPVHIREPEIGFLK